MSFRPGPLIRNALQILLSDPSNTLFVLAPTGYGKTIASPWIAEQVIRQGLATGLIHVVPLRSLVRRIFIDIFSKFQGSGYQMSTPTGGSNKSPYFMRRLVVSTIDSYIWNLYRVPVLEYWNIAKGVSAGHYYPVVAAMLSSVNVIDEAHIYLSEDASQLPRFHPYQKGVGAMLAALSYLSWIGTPTVVETATMHPQTITELIKLLRQRSSPKIVTWDCLGKKLNLAAISDSVMRLVPRGNDPWRSKVKWRTKIYKYGWDDSLLRDIMKHSHNGPILVVTNTVKRAVDLYGRLRGLASTSVALIHGRLSEADREKAEDNIRRVEKNGRGIIVSTQVVEVGVDVNSIAVYTDPAPAENLVQRAGRACRRNGSLDWCENNEGMVTIVLTPGQQLDSWIYNSDTVRSTIYNISDVINSGKNINWREPCPTKEASYYDLILRQQPPILSLDTKRFSNLFKEYLRQDGTPQALLNFLDTIRICSLFRETLMIPIYTGNDYVQASLDWALRGPGKKYLEKCPNSQVPCILAVQRGKPCGEAPATRLARAVKSGKCSAIAMAIQKDLSHTAKNCPEGPLTYALKARQGAYKKGIGLV